MFEPPWANSQTLGPRGEQSKTLPPGASERLPPGTVSTQRRRQLDSGGRAYRPRGITFLSKTHHSRHRSYAESLLVVGAQ